MMSEKRHNLAQKSTKFPALNDLFLVGHAEDGLAETSSKCFVVQAATAAGAAGA
jgi:hypothetical protein